MQTHRYSFFGQKTALILQSGDWTDPWMFLTFIKKRDANKWEKLSEGKTIKLSLPEIIALRDVVVGTKPEWKTFHQSNGTGTPISARLESGKEGHTLLLSTGEYLRPIAYPETVILEKLLDHVFEEKIVHATGVTKPIPDEPVPEKDEGTPDAPEPEAEEANTPAPLAPAMDEGVAETFAKFKFSPLPQRLPNGALPITGRLKSIRWDQDQGTLFIKLASGAMQEVPAAVVVGAALHGSEVDLVVKQQSSPQGDKKTNRLGNPPEVPVSKKAKMPKTPTPATESPAPAEVPPATIEPAVVLATSVKKVTGKALLVLNAGGTELWIPKSALADASPAPAGPQDGVWRFAVKSWFAQKPDFQNWVKST